MTSQNHRRRGPALRAFVDEATRLDPLSTNEYHAMRASAMTEAQLQAAVVASAKRRGWLVYHTHDSRRSEAGYPDLHLIHPGAKRSLFRELKRGNGRVSDAQQTWLDALTAAGCDAAVWRPIHWFDGTIDHELDVSRPW